jgi:hypothetical protein
MNDSKRDIDTSEVELTKRGRYGLKRGDVETNRNRGWVVEEVRSFSIRLVPS